MTQASEFILIVDDNPANLAVLAQTLKGAGCAVRVAVDGESAIELALEELPSLILLDIMMPGIDGFETCRRLKENPVTCDVPVIFMTALTDSEKKVEGLSIGAIDYVTKPFNESEVLARVLIHLRLQNLLHKLQKQNEQLKQEIAQRQIAEQKLHKLNYELQKTQIRLLQQEKLSSIGELLTGIGYELNNPIGCIAGNINFVQEYAENLLSHVALYQERFPDNDSILKQHARQIELDYIAQDLPAVVKSIQSSTSRITAISKFLQIFHRLDIQRDQKYNFDLHELIDGALLVLKHRLKAQEDRPAIEVTRTYGDLFKIPCFPGQLNQAFTNLLTGIINAFDQHYTVAEDETQDTPIPSLPGTMPLQIQIKTELERAWVIVRIRGNVGGISTDTLPEALTRGQDSNSVRRDPELGISIARQIVVDVHGGEFSCVSTFATEFTMMLPI
ncbi:response regulator [Oscillatoria sp. CS-180]|uniref:hybrid sensor histidine kinase/response regulator n=1 Tax=Oscillatoria sp. CS-180 TaxID=3021720 RepID=UPI0023312847|nr:response regulator [Oscillatoria sp. CS-180]MDB9528058.1 response regulator [Oscillatoria sp. CS-180]